MDVGDPRLVGQHGAGHPTYHVKVIELKIFRDFMDRRVTSPTWGPTSMYAGP